MIRIACSDSEASCLIASLITEIAMPCPCEGGPLRICGTGPDGAPAEVRILGGGVYEIEGPTAETVAIIREKKVPVLSERKDQELTIITKARDLVDETMSRTKKFDKRLRFTLSNRIDEKALDVLEAIVEANEINPAIETDPQRRAKLCMVRFDLQTSALTGCKMLLIFLDIAKTHGQIDNRACEFWTKRVLDVKYMTAAWRKKDAARFR